jgi:hypothetical protein
MVVRLLVCVCVCVWCVCWTRRSRKPCTRLQWCDKGCAHMLATRQPTKHTKLHVTLGSDECTGWLRALSLEPPRLAAQGC